MTQAELYAKFVEVVGVAGFSISITQSPQDSRRPAIVIGHPDCDCAVEIVGGGAWAPIRNKEEG